MEICYKRSMSETYMVIGGEELQTEDNYQIPMLLENQVQALLPCKIQKMNGEQFFYYKITGCQSLQNLFEKRKFNRNELEKLFLSVLRIMERLDEYLLDRDFLLLRPSCIFKSKENESYAFVWVPCSQGNIEGEFRQLTEYILPKIDHTDKNAVTLGYGIYKESMESNLRMDFLKKQICVQEEERFIQPEEEDTPIEEKEQERQRILDDFYKEEEEEKGGIVGKIWPVFSILIGAGFFFVVRNLWVYGSTFLLAVLLGTVVVLGLAGGLGYFFWKKKREKREQLFEKGADIEKEENPWQEPGRYASEESYETEAGTTMVLQENRRAGAYLEELDEASPEKFFLEKEIIILGKWKGNVDIWLDVPTISRLHAKIIQRGKEHFLVDINSKNGTMLNDVWINPEEEYALKNGDIIVFAQKKFRYLCTKEKTERCYGLQ